jgi:multidrug resistance efflux pump
VPIPFSRTLRSLRVGESRHPGSKLAVGGVLLAAWAAWFFLADVDVYEVTHEARLEVQTRAHPVHSEIDGRVIAVKVKIGQLVHEGDPILELDAELVSRALSERREQSAALERRIEVLVAETQAAEAADREARQMSAASIEQARALEREADEAARLAADKVTRLEQLDKKYLAEVKGIEARAEAESKKAALDAARASAARLGFEARTIDRRSVERGEQLRGQKAALEGELATKRAEIRTLEESIARHTLRARIDGRIGEIASIEPGTYVREGDRIATVLPDGGMRIIALFPPSSAFGRIRSDQHGRMLLHGFPWTQYGAIDAKVDAVAAETRDGLVRVELSVLGSKSVPLEHGMPGTVEIQVEEVPPAVLVLRVAGRLL